MKKTLILLGMLSIGYAYAQEGNVGINTEEPKATLEIQPSIANLTGTTNEGLLIPRLTKARVIAIASGNLVEGTKVYVTDEVTAADTQFIGTGKGFYFYNGTKWVKQLDTDSITQNEELWATDGTEYYLKASKDGENLLGMIRRSDDTSTFVKIAGMENLSASPYVVDGLSGFRNQAGDLKIITSKVLGNENKNFSFNRFYIEPTHTARATGSLDYLGVHNGLYVNENTGKDLGLIIGSGNISRIGNASSNLSQNANQVFGTSNIVDFYSSGKSNLITGTYSAARNQNKGGVVETLRSGRFLSQNASTATNVDGILVESILTANATSTTLTGVNSSVTLHRGSTVTDVYGYKFSRSVNQDANIANAYGLYIDNVNFGKEKNFSIYTRQGIAYIGDKLGVGTETPTERIEANGNILANKGALISNRSNPIGGYLELINPLKTETGTISNWRIYNMSTGEGTNDYVNGLHFWGVGNASTMVITDSGNVGVGFASKVSATSSVQSNEKFEVNGNIRSTSLTGIGDRPVYADENGVLKIGESTATPSVEIGSTTNMECNAENRGKMNFVKDDTGFDVFGICMKGTNGYSWRYLYGNSGVSSGTGTFGSGLQ